jgi:hypothetical protein
MRVRDGSHAALASFILLEPALEARLYFCARFRGMTDFQACALQAQAGAHGLQRLPCTFFGGGSAGAFDVVLAEGIHRRRIPCAFGRRFATLRDSPRRPSTAPSRVVARP